MKVYETTVRDCCQPWDIRSNNGIGYCEHCKREFRRQHFTDAAGDTDWEWVPVERKRAAKKATDGLE